MLRPFRQIIISWHHIPRLPFISVCQNIMASSHISDHRLFCFANTSRHLSRIIEHLTIAIFYRLNWLSWFFNYPSLLAYHGIIISAQWVKRYLISLSVACLEMSQLVIWQSAHEGKMSDLAQAGYMLVQLRLPAYLYGKNRHKANAHDGKRPIQPIMAICVGSASAADISVR